MPLVHLLSEAVRIARQLGFQIREEPLEGAGGGHCLIRGEKWLLLDLTQSHEEQLRDVVDAIQSEPHYGSSQLSPELLNHLQPLSRAA